MARRTRIATETEPASATSIPDRQPATSFSLPHDLAKQFRSAQSGWDAARNTDRLWNRDASLWTNSDASRSLGWLDIVSRQLDDLAKFKGLAAEIREDGYKHLLVLGVGESSLCVELFGSTYGKQPGFPELLLLDSTDPVQIKSFRDRIDPVCTLFCVSSKSGTAWEPSLLLQYFFEETKKLVRDGAGDHFIAITDPGSALDSTAARLNFRRVYHGSRDIRGGYSALSDLSLVPHAAVGLDTEKLLKATVETIRACQDRVAARNPGVSLGLLLGTAAAAFHRNKVTIICSESISALGAWLEQLIAESIGKAAHGLIPVNQEPLLYDIDDYSSVYGNDRVFAYLKLAGDDTLDAAVLALETAGEPVIRICIDDPSQLGQVFFQWEIAMAVAGSMIGLNPFDQPGTGALERVTGEVDKPIVEADGLRLFADETNAKHLLKSGSSVGTVLRQHMDRIMPGDYFALLAYVPMFRDYEERLQEIRKAVVANNHVATVLGFGPRFLHSAAQAYESGPNSGVFLQITCDDTEDLSMPGHPFTFGAVKAAQSGRAFQVLNHHQRRALRVHLTGDVSAGLDHLRDLICAAIEH